MRNLTRRGAALGLALTMTITAASASNALGWDLHKSQVPISQGTTLEKSHFWSDTYSDLRTEYFVSYAPNENVTPAVSYGDYIVSRANLSSMAESLESQGKRVVSGLNGDWYVMATGATTGLVITDGVVRATPYYSTAWAIGFREDGTAFIGQPNVSASVTFGGQERRLTGAINKVRKVLGSDGTGGLTLLTSDFASTTQNTQAGVDVVLVPADDGTGQYSDQPRINQKTRYVVEQVLESTGSIAIPEGKAVLTLNGSDDAALLAALRALQPGDEVVLSVTADEQWEQAVQALGGVDRILSGGQVASGLDTSRTACSAVGIKADGTLVFYAMDGRQSGYSVGATISQVAQRLAELGCVEAISMDGGGSTTIGATYPDQEGMQVVNRPSEGTERANSTAIFLTTDLEPTGELAGYYVTPGDDILLAGAQVQLSAVGLDSAYYTMDAGSAVSWSVASGGGTVDANGLYTAGTESGSVQVTAGDGTYSGTAWLTVVSTPDSITVAQEESGESITSLNLLPGQQMGLTASAVWRNLDLTAQDGCFTWSVQGAAGTVDQNGLFTASASSASGTLTVTAGDTTVSIPVSVAGHVTTLADGEGDLSAFTSTDTATVAAETNLEYVHNGRGSLRVDYQAGQTGAARLETDLAIPEGENWLSLWVYGDGSGNTLMGSAGEESFLLTALDFTGWQRVIAELPEGAETFTGLSVVYGGGEGQQSGTIWLDQLTTANERVEDNAAPSVTLTVNGTSLTATVEDDVDRTIAEESLALTYDGAELDFTWNEASGALTASLPAGDGGYHRVTLTAGDASGNLGRASADISPSAARTSPFGDMTGHWAEQYATFLYDQGISQGTGGDVPQYQPDRSITRAEFFAMAANWLGVDLTQYESVELPFADAGDIPAWALPQIKAVYSLGLLQGTETAGGELLCNPLATISRAEAITLLGRTQARGYAEDDLSAFTDADQVPQWAASYIKTLVAQGVVNGTNDQIRPSGLLTRGEVAKLLYGML